ncbi:MAG: hypothetical protein H6511_02335 [Holophagales bacterium]|nr:hypothetical protein [Holophagales bacterium]
MYSDVSDPTFREWRAELQADKVLESLEADLNSGLKIPADVTITVGECGTENAFYQPQERAIVVCWELIRDFYDGARELGWSEEAAQEAAENATEFFFYHELGHALIHVLDLPTTGREEDAVDQLSVYVLATEGDDGPAPALDAALAFLAWAEEADAAGAQAAFWDEHSLDKVRFFNIVCWVYGTAPGRYQDLVSKGTLPANRAERCPGEWAQIDKSWSQLLAPSLKAN